LYEAGGDPVCLFVCLFELENCWTDLMKFDMIIAAFETA
jgi:hypothetical protein